MKKHSTNIGKRLMRLVLTGSLLVFLVISGICAYGMFEIGQVLERRSGEWGQLMAGNIGEFEETRAEKRLVTITRLHARHVELAWRHLSQDPGFVSAMKDYAAQGSEGSKRLEEDLRFLLEDEAAGYKVSNFILECSSGDVLLSGRETGTFASVPGIQDMRDVGEADLAEAARRMAAGETGILPVTADGKEYYLSFAPVENLGWSYGILLDKEDVLDPGQEVRQGVLFQMEEFRKMLGGMFLSLLLGIALLFLLLFGLIYYISRRFSEKFFTPIRQMEEVVKEITQGHLDKKLDIHTGDEMEHLAVCFNAMTYELNEYTKDIKEIVSEQERIQAELNVAKHIQASMLPGVFPPFPEKRELDIYATMDPAKFVGGDFYDFYLTDDNHLMITIADVSGKGVPAALFMMTSQTVLRNFAMMMRNPDNLSEVMSRTNDQLCRNNEEEMFVTVFLGMLDLKTGVFTYVNGGHNPPLIGRRNEGKREFEYLSLNKSCVLGMMEKRSFSQLELTLAPGDMLFFYTDGVTEAMNPEAELYSEERLKARLDSIEAGCSAEQVLNLVREDLSAYAGDAEQSDDITMLGLIYKGGR